ARQTTKTRKPIVCPTLAKNRRGAQTNKDLVVEAPSKAKGNALCLHCYRCAGRRARKHSCLCGSTQNHTGRNACATKRLCVAGDGRPVSFGPLGGDARQISALAEGIQWIRGQALGCGH